MLLISVRSSSYTTGGAVTNGTLCMIGMAERGTKNTARGKQVYNWFAFVPCGSAEITLHRRFTLCIHDDGNLWFKGLRTDSVKPKVSVGVLKRYSSHPAT